MKIRSLTLFMLLLSFIGNSEEPELYGMLKYDDVYISQTEVSIKNWLLFVDDVHFDETVPEEVEKDLPKKWHPTNEFVYEVFLNKWRGKGKKKVKVSTMYNFYVYLTKSQKKDKKKILKYMNMPVTGVTYNQVQDYFDWLTEIYESIYPEIFDKYEVDISLPTKEILEKLHQGALRSKYDKENRVVGDSVNVEGCRLFNFKVKQACAGSEFREEKYGSINGILPINSYNPDINGFFNVLGNVAEMTQTKDVAFGGHYDNYAKTALENPLMRYDGPSDLVGFRYVIHLKKK